MNIPQNFYFVITAKKKHYLNSGKLDVSYWGPKLLNEFCSNEEKEIASHLLFQKRMKAKLLDMENELSYF